MKDDSIPVVVEPEAKESAYQMGYARFSHEPDVPTDEHWFGHYTESAEWANSKLPRLRAMSGAKDSMGVGTHTNHGEIIVVEYPEDRPMEGRKAHSAELTDELVDMFRYGAQDKIEGKEPDVTRWD